MVANFFVCFEGLSLVTLPLRLVFQSDSYGHEAFSERVFRMSDLASFSKHIHEEVSLLNF